MNSSNGSLKFRHIEYSHTISIFNWHKNDAVADGDDPHLYGILDENKLQSCLSIPLQSFYDVDTYPTVAAKAAAYFYYFNRYHVFSDGNKRVSVSVMLTFLVWNGCTPSYDLMMNSLIWL